MSRSLLADEREKAASAGQGHLFKFWDQLDSNRQQILLEEISRAGCENIHQLYQQSTSQKDDWSALAQRAQPPEAIRLSEQQSIFYSDACHEGKQAFREGKVGAILVAGGQGTRLGFNHPKGIYSIGPVSNASLFQILLEKILAAAERYGTKIPLYIMTSDATHVETAKYLQHNHYFGLSPDDVRLFRQGVMPAIDAATGKILLADKGHLALNPDGHGGMLAALERTGNLADIKRRNVEHLFYFQVDNPMVQISDPFLLGCHILRQSEMTTLAVPKRHALDRVGNIVSVDGRTQVIEYSDFPDTVAHQKNPDGSLKFWAASVAIHVFDAGFLQRASRDASALPFHVARKKVSYIDDQGIRLEPSTPNAIKFERFIFDLMPRADRALNVEGPADTWFSPVKNAPGEPSDSPETCQAAMIALHRQWLTAAGAKVAANVPVEISPLFALDAAELKQKLDKEIKQGLEITQPKYLR